MRRRTVAPVTPEFRDAILLLGVVFGPRVVTGLTNRFVTKADDAEKKAADERDAREKAMAEKIDAIVATLAEMKSEANTARERQTALAAAHAEVKARIDGMSENYGRRLGQLEQEVAALKAGRKR